MHKVKELLQHVAATANEADALCYQAAGEQQTELAEQLRHAVCRIGWMADLALTRLGHPPVVGGAEDWLLPPSYHWEDGVPRKTRHDS
jgi:hypothetical protein